jgi:hypothetical protein
VSWKRAALLSNAPWAPPRLARARVAARRAPPLSALLAGEGGRGRTPSFGGCWFFFPVPVSAAALERHRAYRVRASLRTLRRGAAALGRPAG